jgi:hypothetical protein
MPVQEQTTTTQVAINHQRYIGSVALLLNMSKLFDNHEPPLVLTACKILRNLSSSSITMMLQEFLAFVEFAGVRKNDEAWLLATPANHDTIVVLPMKLLLPRLLME